MPLLLCVGASAHDASLKTSVIGSLQQSCELNVRAVDQSDHGEQ